MESYLSVANEALADPSALDRWRSFFSDSCSVCLSGFEAASSIHKQGHSIEGGQLLAWRATKEATTSDQVAVLVTGDIDAAIVRSEEGEVVSTYDSVDSATVLYTVRRQPNEAWLVVAGELVG